MTTTFKVPALDDYWRWFEPHLRPFSAEEQRAAAALYGELARASPSTPINWAGRSGSLRRTPKRCSKPTR